MILHGDCREQLVTLPDCSVDAIVTDPPYELGFMGKKWDASGIAYDGEVWSQCLRVLKPGGHLCAFGGTRTYHRMTVAIEDAGFEIRDSLHWLYGSGFPKSLDVSKAIDKARYDRTDILTVADWLKPLVQRVGAKLVAQALNVTPTMVSQHWCSHSQTTVPTLDQVPTLLEVLGLTLDDVPDDIRTLLWDLNGRKGQPGDNWWKREIVGTKMSSLGGTVAAGERDADFIAKHRGLEFNVTTPATDAAVRWAGWGTALKPAHEPIVLARKPLVGTVAANVMEYGTGALNIDATRVAGALDGDPHRFAKTDGGSFNAFSRAPVVRATGRWPANIILTHSPECEQTGTGTSRIVDRARGRRPGWSGLVGGVTGDPMPNGPTYDDTPERWNCVQGCPVATLNEQSENAARYFTSTEWDPELDAPFLYVAKPSRAERNAGLDGMTRRSNGFQTRYCTDCGRNIPTAGSCGHNAPTEVRDATPAANFHPTVKPVALIRYLIRLITPPDGTVLDPFLGSGTTAVAAILEGFDWIGCELTDDYLPIIEARTAWAEQNRPEPDLTLFTEQP